MTFEWETVTRHQVKVNFADHKKSGDVVLGQPVVFEGHCEQHGRFKEIEIQESES